MLGKGIACVLLLSLASTCMADSELKQAFKEVTDLYGEWGYGYKHERRGQICDTYRQWNAQEIAPDNWRGCAVLFVADPDDYYDLGTVAEGEQDNFLNTQHYKKAWNLHGEGFLGTSLPRAPQDLDPVCLFARVDDRMVLGYEEGNGDKLLPCPGHDKAVPFTEEMVLAAMNDTALAEDMCTQCYQAVCTGRGSRRAKDCGNSGTGGKDLEDGAIFEQQADPVYHCHLTMADEGACDYVQYVQHEATRDYYMDYSVLCGWDNIQYLNITYCDCTKVAGTANNCKRYEAMEMAYAGVVCGNCNGAGFNTDTAFSAIFDPYKGADFYAGQCGHQRTLEDGTLAKNYSKMMCSKKIWCANGYNGGDNCKFHCDHYGLYSEVYYDEDCGGYPDFDRELCVGDKCFYVPEEKKTYAAAEEDCEARGGHLASVLSEEENAAVYQLRINVGGSVWIGFDDIDQEGTFTWVDGSTTTFTNWAGGQPDDHQQNEDCTEIWGGGVWNDNNCQAQFFYVCSKDGSFGNEEEARRRLLSANSLAGPRELTLDTEFDWGHVVSDVKATGWGEKKKRKTL